MRNLILLSALLLAACSCDDLAPPIDESSDSTGEAPSLELASSEPDIPSAEVELFCYDSGSCMPLESCHMSAVGGCFAADECNLAWCEHYCYLRSCETLESMDSCLKDSADQLAQCLRLDDDCAVCLAAFQLTVQGC